MLNALGVEHATPTHLSIIKVIHSLSEGLIPTIPSLLSPTIKYVRLRGVRSTPSLRRRAGLVADAHGARSHNPSCKHDAEPFRRDKTLPLSTQ